MKAASTTIRIPSEMHEELRGFAEEGRSTLTAVLVEALELYRRERFVAKVNAGYSQLREETAAWKEHVVERAAWDATMPDGLPPPRTVLPVTSTVRSIPSHVPIQPPEGGLDGRSAILADQVRTIARERLVRRSGAVSRATLIRVEEVVRILLGL